MLPILIAVCCGIFLYSMILLIFGNSSRERVRKRLSSLMNTPDMDSIHNEIISEKKKDRHEKKHSRLISKRFEDTLALSGIKMSAREYVTLWGALTVCPALVGALLGLNVIAVLGLCIIGFAIPPVMVQNSRNKRKLLFNKQLGESLTVMSNSIRTGYSFQQALAGIASEMQPPISTEFGRVVREVNYGATLEQALNNMTARIRNEDLDLLVSAVITSTQVGSNLSEILDTISGTVDERIKLREEIRTLTAQGRMSGIIIGLLPIVIILMLMVMNPTYINDFIAHPLGRIMLIVSGIMELLGFVVINRMVDIKY